MRLTGRLKMEEEEPIQEWKRQFIIVKVADETLPLLSLVIIKSEMYSEVSLSTHVIVTHHLSPSRRCERITNCQKLLTFYCL